MPEANIFESVYRSSRAFNNHFPLHDCNEFIVGDKATPRLGSPNSRSKTPRLISELSWQPRYISRVARY